MANITLPYGRENKTVCIPDERLRGILVSGAHGYHAEKQEREIVRDAMEHPIGSPRLRELAKGKDNIVLIASDPHETGPEQSDFSGNVKGDQGRQSKCEINSSDRDRFPQGDHERGAGR